MESLIPIFGILTGMVVPVAVFIWLYYEGKGKRETILEISKNINDSSKVEELLKIFEERKKERYNNFCWHWSLSSWLHSSW